MHSSPPLSIHSQSLHTDAGTCLTPYEEERDLRIKTLHDHVQLALLAVGLPEVAQLRSAFTGEVAAQPKSHVLGRSQKREGSRGGRVGRGGQFEAGVAVEGAPLRRSSRNLGKRDLSEVTASRIRVSSKRDEKVSTVNT